MVMFINQDKKRGQKSKKGKNHCKKRRKKEGEIMKGSRGGCRRRKGQWQGRKLKNKEFERTKSNLFKRVYSNQKPIGSHNFKG